jgi:hypothetical protein
MRLRLRLTVPGAPRDVVRFLREAVAAEETEASADAERDPTQLDAATRQLLTVDWSQLVPDVGETTSLDFDDHEHFGGKVRVVLSQTATRPLHSTSTLAPGSTAGGG